MAMEKSVHARLQANLLLSKCKERRKEMMFSLKTLSDVGEDLSIFLFSHWILSLA